jgi:hypothetical protein
MWVPPSVAALPDDELKMTATKQVTGRRNLAFIRSFSVSLAELHTGKRREFRFFERLALPKNCQAIPSRLAKLL